MSIFIDVAFRWLLRQPAVRRLLQVELRRTAMSDLSDKNSDLRQAMFRVIRAEARDLFSEERERAREVIELSVEYRRWAEQEREAVQAKAYAEASSQALVDASERGFIPGTALPNIAPADDPLTSPWDAPPPPRCDVCSEPIKWSEYYNGWIHCNTPNVPHASIYALADVESTAVLPLVENS
jgi:hypothetical protein